MNNDEWLMPAYYSRFRCKCDQCRHSCCHGWNIPVSREEYYRLISMDCSENLRQRIDHSFIEPQQVSEERFRIISFNYQGDCPIQKDGLCSLHKAKGEEALPMVCRLYPRSLKRVNGVNIACCSSSCERVVELLMDEQSLNIIKSSLKQEAELQYQVDPDFIRELADFNRILSNPKETLAQKIMEICLQVNEKEFKQDYNAYANPLSEALLLLQKLVHDHNLLSDIKDEVIERYQNNYFQYELDRISFEQDFPKWQILFENILNNSLLYENFPFVDLRFNKADAYRGLCASYGLLRLVCIGYHARHTNKEDLVDSIAALFHLIDHTSFYYNVNVLIDSAAILLKL